MVSLVESIILNRQREHMVLKSELNFRLLHFQLELDSSAITDIKIMNDYTSHPSCIHQMTPTPFLIYSCSEYTLPFTESTEQFVSAGARMRTHNYV